MKIKNLIYYFIIFICFAFAKIAYVLASNDNLTFILKPLSKVISLITNANYNYTQDLGFYFNTLNITIDKSCSGVNFWLISFVVFAILLIRNCKTQFQKIALFPILILVTYIFTLFANTSRILISLFIEKQTDLNYSWLHQAEGVFIYLSFLIITYSILNYFLSKKHAYNEKLT